MTRNSKREVELGRDAVRGNQLLGLGRDFLPAHAAAGRIGQEKGFLFRLDQANAGALVEPALL